MTRKALARIAACALIGLGLATWLSPAAAEPWIAVKEGMKCGVCHVNASGGGMRTPYGNIYAQMQLAATRLAEADAKPWTGQLTERVAVGGNLRASATRIDVPDAASQNLFDVDEARLYFLFSPLPGRLDVYLDQRVAPGASTNQEAWVRYWLDGRNWYLKAGKMYLPWGWRLEDDTAFVRTVPGISFATPDTGVEIGWETANWTSQLAVSNGTAGGPELDDGKQASLRVARLFGGWRLGASANLNDTALGERSMQNVFAGWRTGPVGWLAEVDFIRDESSTGVVRQRVALLEANWWMRQGHNLKFTFERLDPDTALDEDEQDRISVVWEYFPIEFLELRVGARMYDGDPAVDVQNRSVYLVQLHGFF